MAGKRSSPKNEKPKSTFSFHIPSEVRGLLLLACVLMMTLSLLSFAYGHPSRNWLGLVGYTIGWILHVTLGIASYGIAGYGTWVAWRLLMGKPITDLVLKSLYFAIGLFSTCILLSLLEERYLSFANTMERLFYPHRRMAIYHLGGSPAYFIYRDIPVVNLQNIFNALGVGILFSSTLAASILFFSRTSVAELVNRLKTIWKKGEALPQEVPVDGPKEEPVDEDFMRYVKVRIPSQSESPQSGLSSNQQELMGIEPEMDLKVRPSISRKQQQDSVVVQEELHLPMPAPAPKSKVFNATKGKDDLPVEKEPNKRREAALKAQRVHNGDFTNYKLPPSSLLTTPKKVDQTALKKDLKKQAEVLEETLLSFGIEAKVGQINCGPTITSFEVHPAIGVKVQKIKTLENDIALNMEAKSIRIIAPIPGKAAVGIEVPNPYPQEVSFKEILTALQQSQTKFRIPLLLGKAVNGDFVMADLTKMPHCIIAGATGSGKSVCINTIVMSILYTARPDEIQLLMVDPKKVELTPYSLLPHMIAPVITEPQAAYTALMWLVKEMEKRYELLKRLGVRNIDGYNQRQINKEFESDLEIEVPEKLPYIVGIVDELADLMMVSNADIETPIARIAQMARAVGIHLILATQRPSREVITGLIKANFPTRISFKVASRVNSQIVLDETGAESLLGNGDMLFLPPGTSHLIRAQGAYIRDEDIHSVVKFICDQAPPNYRFESFEQVSFNEDAIGSQGGQAGGSKGSAGGDALYKQALDVVLGTGNASTTFLQRKLKIGYARAASLMDQLQADGVVSAADGSKARRILAHRKDDAMNDEEMEE